MTTGAYAPLSAAEQIAYDLFWEPLIKSGETAIAGLAPVLAFPIIAGVDNAIIGAVADYVFQKLRLLIDVTAIKIVNAAHRSAYDEASLELAVVAEEKGIDSDDYKNARAAARAALSRFTQLSQ